MLSSPTAHSSTTATGVPSNYPSALPPLPKVRNLHKSAFVKNKSLHKISFYLNFEDNNKGEKYSCRWGYRFCCGCGFSRGCLRCIILYLICGFLSFGNLLFYLLCFNFKFNVLFWQHYSVGVTHWNVVIPRIVLIGSISILIIEKGISLTLLG